MRLRPSLLSLLLLCAAPLCLTGCNFGDGSQPPDSNPDGGTSPDGGTPDTSTTDFARQMISTHNSVRISATPTPSPALPALTWSNKAAAEAQAWADQCNFSHNPKLGSLNLGENIFAATPGSQTPATVVQSWASESANYDYGQNACAPGQTCGHYTQIVWRSTTQVGCAKKDCDKNSPFSGFPQWQFWVCDYSPPGNFIGQRPY